MASSRPSRLWPIVTLAVAVLAFIIALPDNTKAGLPGFFKPGLHLGLDLAGGTQLDYRISEDEINAREQKLRDEIAQAKKDNQPQTVTDKQIQLDSTQQQHANLVEAIRNVLERRINSLGVSEATITPSYYGNEKHLLVECPGVVDIERCKATVGKTIRLEFKEQFTGSGDTYIKGIRAQADKIYRDVTGTGSLQVIGEDVSSQLGAQYVDAGAFYENELTDNLKQFWNRKVSDPPLMVDIATQSFVQNPEGQSQIKENKGIVIGQVVGNRKPAERQITDPAEALPYLQSKTPNSVYDHKESVPLTAAPAALQKDLGTMKLGEKQLVKTGSGEAAIVYLTSRIDGTEEMNASHILVSYKGADRAEPTVTRTKAEALARAQALKKQLDGGADFTALAGKESDGDSKNRGGSLGTLKKGVLGTQFDTVAFALKQGQISQVVETQFGYHIIRADTAAHTTPATVSYNVLTIRGANADKTAQALIAQIDDKKIVRTEDQITLRFLYLPLEAPPWKDTPLNGERFRAATVVADPVTNVPVVQIQFDDEGGKLFQDMTKRNIGKPIAIFVGGQEVSEPVVNTEIIGTSAIITGRFTYQEAQDLAQNLNTGAIPAPIHLSGQSTVEATLGSNALQQSVYAGMIGLALLALFMIVIYRMLGVMACIALLFYVILLIALTKLPILLVSREYVVLTLAGIAGMILSMGMAVDANVLAFERVKEELRKGKLLRTAVDTGFKRAWPSVRDGNMSTLITCAILFTIGTSIIRGFAVTLSIGIFLSLFTAIIVSRWLCRQVALSALAGRTELFGVKQSDVGSQRDSHQP